MPELVDRDMQAQQQGARQGQVSVFTCPECGGAMWQVPQDELTRFRCHVGHAYYGETLLEEQSQALEAALWTAIRTFKEKAVLARQLAARERERNNPRLAERFQEDAQLAERYGQVIQQMLTQNGSPAPGQSDAGWGGPGPQAPGG
jgi:two-component system chemotaxis response regulator CheB